MGNSNVSVQRRSLHLQNKVMWCASSTILSGKCCQGKLFSAAGNPAVKLLKHTFFFSHYEIFTRTLMLLGKSTRFCFLVQFFVRSEQFMMHRYSSGDVRNDNLCEERAIIKSTEKNKHKNISFLALMTSKSFSNKEKQ